MALIKFITLSLYLIITTLIFITSNTNTNTSSALAIVVVPNDAAARNRIRNLKISAGSNAKHSKTRTTNYNRVDPRPDCTEIGSRSECKQISNCRWCKSEALDDMCFSKSEAWRLPSQVFTCDL